MIIKQRERRRSDRAAFTLMEVLVVVAILVILAGTASIFVFKALDDAKEQRCQSDVHTLTEACKMFRLRNESFPESLDQLLQPPEGGKPYLDNADFIRDPWSQPYKYDPNGANNGGLRPDIWTVTPEGKTIGNWMSTNIKP